MGFLDRFRNRGKTGSEEPPSGSEGVIPPSRPEQRRGTTTVTATLYTGGDTLEVVGESHYQDALWRSAGVRAGTSDVRKSVIAVLMPQPDNPYDENSVAVQVDASIVGHLSREDAAVYVGPINRMMRETGSVVALEGQIVGGGTAGMLGLFLVSCQLVSVGNSVLVMAAQ